MDLGKTLRSLVAIGWLMPCLTGCTPSDPGSARLPGGAYIAGKVSSLEPLLSGLRSLTGTPLAERAHELSTRLAGCEEFVGAASETADVWDAIGCSSLANEPASVRIRLADAGGVFAFPIAMGEDASARLEGTLRTDVTGGVRVEAKFDAVSHTAFAKLLRPAASGAGPAILSPQGALVHGRLKPEDGLDLAELVPEGGQGDNLFKLKSRLFSSAVLDGTLEFVVYAPATGQLIPPVVIAAGVKFEAAARAAMEKLIAELDVMWSLQPERTRFGEREGICLVDMQLLSELDPCTVVAKGMILVGWNRASIERALAAGEGPVPGLNGGFVAHLDRFREADELLRETWAPDSSRPTMEYPWRDLRADIERRGDSTHLNLVLRPSSSLQAAAW